MIPWSVFMDQNPLKICMGGFGGGGGGGGGGNNKMTEWDEKEKGMNPELCDARTIEPCGTSC